MARNGREGTKEVPVTSHQSCRIISQSVITRRKEEGVGEVRRAARARERWTGAVDAREGGRRTDPGLSLSGKNRDFGGPAVDQ